MHFIRGLLRTKMSGTSLDSLCTLMIKLAMNEIIPLILSPYNKLSPYNDIEPFYISWKKNNANPDVY